VWFAEGFILLAAIGLWISRKRLRLEWLLLVGATADFLWVLGTPYLSGVGGLMPGRYLYPAAAAAMVLVAAGIEALPLLVARAATATGGAGALLALVLLVSGPFGLVAHHEAFPQAGAGMPVHAHGATAGLDVAVDRLATGNGGGAAWVHGPLHRVREHTAL